MRNLLLVTLTAGILSTGCAQERGAAGGSAGGIAGEVAPKWEVDAWMNLPREKTSLEISDLKGKIIYLYCFQSWCPGCHSHGFPTMKKVREKYAGSDDVVFLAVQTVFEGYHANTMANGAKALKKFGLDIPLGLSGTKGKPSNLMRNYKTRGTPWTIVIGKDGKVLTDGFHVNAEEAIASIEKGK